VIGRVDDHAKVVEKSVFLSIFALPKCGPKQYEQLAGQAREGTIMMGRCMLALFDGIA